MHAKKSLGQHFLKSEKALSEIIAAAALTPTDVALEIGPGTGILTKRLLAVARSVVCIEKDASLVPILQEMFAEDLATGKLKLIEGDVLKFDPSFLTRYKLVANIPYYITGAIIEQFLNTPHQPIQMVLLIQKEVAERIVAKDKKESVLSIAVRAYGTPKIVAKVPAGAFNPPPRVDSAIVSIENISRDFFRDFDEQSFFKLIKFVFGKKRGQLGGRLGDYLGNRVRAVSILATCGIDPKLRPENLTLQQWKQIAIALQ